MPYYSGILFNNLNKSRINDRYDHLCEQQQQQKFSNKRNPYVFARLALVKIQITTRSTHIVII